MGYSSEIAAPLSRQNIRRMARHIRELMGLENQLHFPILPFMEIVLPQLDFEFYYEVLPIEEMGECLGLTYPEEHKIFLRQDVYLGAAEGIGVHRFTVAHEIGHFFLHDKKSVALARIGPTETIPTYKNPEWQADCFAGELLVPSHLIRGMNSLEVSRICEVSVSAAQMQLSKRNR